MAMLEVKDLQVFYDNIQALRGVSLEINEGEVVSIIGANGAGKTTTLQTISGLISPKSGSINFEGKNLLKEKANNICKLGIAQVPEGRRIFSQLAVKDNLKLGQFTVKDTVENKEKDRANFYKIFPRMSERKNQSAGTLSGGEQQMLAMGRALMSRPKLLLLDEPSMGLSPLYVEKIFKVIEMLREEKITMLLVEQNANLALEVSDRAYVLETGKIVKEGSAKELKNDPTIKTAYLGE